MFFASVRLMPLKNLSIVQLQSISCLKVVPYDKLSFSLNCLLTD